MRLAKREKLMARKKITDESCKRDWLTSDLSFFSFYPMSLSYSSFFSLSVGCIRNRFSRNNRVTPSNNIIKEMNPKRNEQGIEREKKFIEDLSVRKP
jgi:hypothetical protein